MTNLSDFSDDEINRILDAPGAVLRGATVADGTPGAFQFIRETASGAKVFREAQEHENDFVRSVAVALRERINAEEAELSPAAKVGTPAGVAVPEDPRPNPERDTARAVELTAAAIAVLGERAEPKDLDAYREWLLRIATQVAKATGSKEGGFFSRRVAISEGERDYLDRLTAALGQA